MSLDFDDTTFETVMFWARRVMNWFKLGGFLNLKSSERCYHVVFNCIVDWTESISIVALVTELSHNQGLQKWHRMQCIKVHSTLRVSPKGDKSPPRIVCREGKQDGQIREFIKFRELIQKKAFVRAHPLVLYIFTGETRPNDRILGRGVSTLLLVDQRRT